MKQDGRTKHPLYNRWLSMKGRCQWKSHTSWKWYGAKGIKVCPRWMVFQNFLSDMGPMPFPNATIERKDYKGDYTPSNCCWATPKQQALNKETALLLTLNGRTQNASNWASELNIPYDLISDRKCKGWSDEEALTTPKRVPGLLQYGEVSRTRIEWAKQMNICAGTIWWRLRHGWSIERALTTPIDKLKTTKHP